MSTSFVRKPRKPQEATWREPVYVMIACAALPLVKAQGLDLIDAVDKVQEQLPSDMQRSRASLKVAVKSKLMRETLASVQRLSEASRQEQIDKLANYTATLTHKVSSRKSPQRWSEHDWALITRRVRYMQRDLGDKRSVCTIVSHAQRVELEPEYWRLPQSIAALPEITLRMMKGVESRLDTLLKDEPFDPGAKPRVPPVLQLQPDDAPAAQPATVAQVITDQPEPPAKSLRDLVRDAGWVEHPVKRAQTPQEPLDERKATLPFTTPEQTPGDPLEAFLRQGVGLLRGVIKEIAAEQAAIERVERRRITEQVVAAAMEAVDARLHQYTRLIMQDMVDQTLGKGIELPQRALEPLAVDLTGSGLDARIKLDVVGLYPRQVAEVKKALNGYADTVRFVEPGKVESWSPRDCVISSTKFASKVVEDKCRNAHAEVHRVWGTSSSVVEAIKGLYAHRGIELDLH